MPLWLEIVLGLGAIILAGVAQSAREWPRWLRALLWLPVTLASAVIGLILIKILEFLFVAMTAWSPDFAPSLIGRVELPLNLIAVAVGVLASAQNGMLILGRSGVVAFLQAAVSGAFTFFVVEGAFDHPYAWLGATCVGFVASSRFITEDK
jgi:hypothetical protein